jgi:hypothetical protein
LKRDPMQMELGMTIQDPLDSYLPEALRTWVEQRYYAQVNAQARFEVLRDDPQFWEAPEKHVGSFSDHGVVHVRDIARQIVQVLDTIHGLLIPSRPPERFNGFMKGYGVILAYLHDIGMADFSAFGRAMHPEFAAQAAFTPEFDPFVAAIWNENHGGLARRVQTLADCGVLQQPPEIVLRELLALTTAHSKSKMPIQTLNDPPALRRAMQRIIGADLHLLYLAQRQGGAVDLSDQRRRELLRRYYRDFPDESFGWLVAEHEQARALVADAIDTLRALRTADALRQRGTVQKTSGGYEIFISQETGGAVYALRLGDDQLYLLETNDPISAGEANIAGTELDRTGNLRISFHRGAFASEAAVARMAEAAAIVVQDIRVDVIESFHRAPGDPFASGIKSAGTIETWLESTDDNPGFADLVFAALQRSPASVSTNISIVPSLQALPDHERNRYYTAAEIAWGQDARRALLERMAHSGFSADTIDFSEAFRHVRLTRVQAGETLIEAGAPAGMVYVPLGDGFRIMPLGGYESFSVQPWMPLGITAVIRGALRNATVIAEQDVEALMIPKDVYLRHWHRTYTAEALRQRLARMP